MINVNQITSQLADMPDQALQQYAQMHKDDPYTLSLAVAESNRRKQMRTAAQGQGRPQPPKVNEQEVQNMAPQQLPEESGIAQLPAQNLARMAGGGIVAFADAGPVREKATTLAQYADQIREEALRQGVDPEMAMRLFQQESGGDKNAVSPKGAAGLGQLMLPAAKDMGLSDKDRYDPDKNIPASIGYLKRQLNTFKDPATALAAYNWGPGNVGKHLAKNNGQLSKIGLPKETADYINKILPIGSAQAQQAQAPQVQAPQVQAPQDDYSNEGRGRGKPVAMTREEMLAQIPTGGSGAGPTPPGPDQRSFFGKAADYMFIPPEYQRNIGNTLNALGGWSSIINVARATGAASRALAPTEEAIAAAKAAADKVSRLRMPPPEASGIAKLTPEALAARRAAETARRTRQLDADRKAATGATQAVDAATSTARIAANAERALMQTPKAVSQANAAANAARAGSAANAGASAMAGPGSPAPYVFGPDRGDGTRDDSRTPEALPGPDPDVVIATAKEARPDLASKGLSADDWLNLGFGLMAGKSQYALQNLGTAGQGMVAARAEKQKAGIESLKSAADMRYKQQHGSLFDAQTEALASGDKLDAQARARAVVSIDRQMADWEDTLEGRSATPEATAKKRREVTVDAYRLQNLEPPGTMGAPPPAIAALTQKYGTAPPAR